MKHVHKATLTKGREPAAVEHKTLEVLRHLLRQLGGSRALAAVDLEASLEKDLGLGSLERVELITRLEQEFSLELPENILGEAETPNDLVRAIVSGGAPTWRKTALGSLGTRALPAPEAAETLIEVLRLRGEADAGRVHLFLQRDDGGEEAFCYGELYREALGLAGGLAARGIGLGDRVALMLPTGKDFFVAFAGALLGGAVPVPLYPPFRLARLEDYAARQAGILRNAGARLFITVRRGRSMGQLLRSRAAELEAVTTVEELVSLAAPAPRVDTSSDAPALIQYTSGSTGDPKGVVLSHGNLLANIRAIGAALQLQPTDVGVSWLPLYHDMGLIGCWLTPLYFAVPMAILSPVAFLSRPERWLWTIHTHRGTHSPAPNFGYELCVRKIRDEALEGLDLSCWRGALNGAEPVSPETIERFTRRFAPYGFRREAMMPVYGLAESSVALAAPPLLRAPRIERVAREAFETEGRGVPASDKEISPLRFVSVGKPLAGHEVRIVDEAGKPLPERREGRLLFRGPSSMKGYYRSPEATRQVSRPGGWLDSGDRAFLADGEVFITGRCKDIIIRAGRNIHPQEVEEIVGDVEAVRRGCVAAFAVSQEEQGTEKLIVVAETRETEAARRREVTRAVQQRLGELLGSPADDVVLVPPGTVPKTSSGKIRRSACKTRYLDGALVHRGRRRPWLWVHVSALDTLERARRLAAWLGRSAYALYVFCLSLVFVLPCWLLSWIVPSRGVVRKALGLAARGYIFLSGCRFRVRGYAAWGRGADAPVILVSNHASYFDAVALMAGVDRDYAFVVKREAARWPIIGTFIRRLGHVLVERRELKESLEGALEAARTLRRGRSVFFFPEATFTRAAGLRPFKLGAFKLAADTGVPVVPLALVGTRRWLRDGTWIPRRSRLEIIIDEPLYPRSSSWSEVVRLRDLAAEAIARHVGEPRLDLVAAGVPPEPSEGG